MPISPSVAANAKTISRLQDLIREIESDQVTYKRKLDELKEELDLVKLSIYNQIRLIRDKNKKIADVKKEIQRLRRSSYEWETIKKRG